MTDQLHKFLFEGMPVRGLLVRLGASWQELLRRHAQAGGYPAAVADLLGQMSAAAVLLQGNIKFNGALQLQIQGDGPVRLAVAEVGPNFAFRATAQVHGDVPEGAPLSELINRQRKGRCAITLDQQDRLPGQQPYQGVVALGGANGQPFERLSEVLEHYMQQSEQLDTKLVLAADAHCAAGLLIQRLPPSAEAHLSGQAAAAARAEAREQSDDYPRIATLAASLQPEELLRLDAETLLHRLFWQEPLLRLQEPAGPTQPRFACRCSRERVAAMLRSLGAAEVDSILAEREQVEIGCEFCGAQYRFDAVDAAQALLEPPVLAAAAARLQ
ncbi:Hsp33 family molecular chaperone HslO [Serpentinimonas barnesii]|uniref:Hsp33 family molecular chaperone HslO n=1 Tax=Serpentinimonas barnesii TaxID=1458427 RepID=UPI00049584FD|nr:Hsp33 family molecular chaperone HslO [Serpentinimonas barnesii]